MLAALQDTRLRGAARMALVDAYALTEGQCWASPPRDGRHFHLLVPAIVMDLLRAVREHLLPPMPKQGA